MQHEEADWHGRPSYHMPRSLTRSPCLLPTACDCSGHSEQCTFDRELFRRTGHGGRCLHCRHHTAGPHCQHCQENFYRWNVWMPCQPCDCHPAGEWTLLPQPLPRSPFQPLLPVPFLPQAPCTSSAMARAPATARPL